MLGVFRDVGIVLGVLGVIATIIFGVSASTRSSVRVLDRRLVGFDDRSMGLGERLVRLDDRLEGLDRRLVDLDDRMVAVDDRLGSLDHRFGRLVEGQQTTNEALLRIENLLRTRLPAA